jgi:hypothetical protein
MPRNWPAGPAWLRLVCRVLRAACRLESGTARISYSDWNTAVLPPPPPASKVVTVSMLAAGLNGG